MITASEAKKLVKDYENKERDKFQPIIEKQLENINKRIKEAANNGKSYITISKKDLDNKCVDFLIKELENLGFHVVNDCESSIIISWGISNLPIIPIKPPCEPWTKPKLPNWPPEPKPYPKPRKSPWTLDNWCDKITNYQKTK